MPTKKRAPRVITVDGRVTCCGSFTTSALDEADAIKLAALLKVLADPARLRLLSLIATAPSDEICACDLGEVVERSQPTISHHLAMLVDAGFVTREQRGRWAWYRTVPAQLAAVRDALTP